METHFATSWKPSHIVRGGLRGVQESTVVYFLREVTLSTGVPAGLLLFMSYLVEFLCQLLLLFAPECLMFGALSLALW